MIVFCDFDGWIGDRKKDGKTGAFGFAGQNENGRKLVDFCEQREMCELIRSFSTKVYISIRELGWIEIVSK